ncbi:hypothetical protein SLS56_000536 [Neofusicoccum ribis]|uniref:Major facilitator superfamily (MFS) profile domain-containing protein n=1 Tax=Neofusicoccum ribis TaxID=45134 RepID=A0ABR3TDF3_9PEZI
MAVEASKQDDTIVTVAPSQPSSSDADGEPPTSAAGESRRSRLARKIWGDEARERKYLRKVDGIFFSYVLLGYFIKYLDQENYSNAFVSGMKEDLELYGNERNLLNTFFNIGIIIGTVPSQMIQLKYVRPSIWIPSCELAWSVLVMVMASAKNIQTLYALRFFVGLLESCAFPGYAAILGSWYGPSQLAKRMALFEQSSGIAGMFSGYLQAGLYTGLNGTAGLAGWRWLFIFDGIISIPIPIWGFFAIPDLPSNTRAFYLNADDRAYGIQRIEKIGRKPPKKLTWKAIKEVYIGWQIWAFILPYLMVAEAYMGRNFFNLYLKDRGYSVVQTNILPTAGNAVSIVAAFLFGWLSDASGSCLFVVNIVQGIMLVSNIIMVIWNVPEKALMAAFYLALGDMKSRSIMQTSGSCSLQPETSSHTLLELGFQDAPHYKYGYQFLIAFGFLAVGGMHLLDFLSKRDK